MRIIREKYLREQGEAYPKAAKYLTMWQATVRAARWKNLADVRRVYLSADAVRVRSGRSVFVFNVCGNTYRLIVAIHFKAQIVFTLRFLTHAEYSRDSWKDEL